MVAVLVLRRTDPARPRPYRTWGHPVTTVLFALAAFLISANAFVTSFWNALAGLGLIVLGVPAYLYWKGSK